MSEAPAATAAAIPAPDANPGSDKPAQTAAATSPSETKSETKAETPASADPPKWRDDWREAIAADDEKELQYLKRYQSFDNWAKAQRELRTKLSSGGYKPALPDNATPEQLAAYRKAWGIPEDAKGYNVELPAIQGVEWSDVDKADLAEFAGRAHAAHIPPAQFKAMVDAYAELRSRGLEQMKEAAMQLTIDRRAAIKSEWGMDYESNVRLANSHLAETLKDDAHVLPSLVLDDGTRLGDHPVFNRYVASNARAMAADEQLASSYTGNNGQSFDQQYQAALDLQWTDPRAYHSKEHQALLLRFAQAAERRTGKAA